MYGFFCKLISWSRPKVGHEFSVDIVNITNRKNLLLLTYIPNHPSGDAI